MFVNQGDALTRHNWWKFAQKCKM